MKNFLKNSGAATAIEFAIILPVLLLFLLGIVQFGLTMFFDSSLNTGIRAVARNGIGGGYDPATGPGQINQIMSANLGGLYDPNQASFIIVTFPNFNFYSYTDTFKLAPNSIFPPTPGPPSVPLLTAQSGQIILYGVRYNWGQTFGITNPFLPKALYSFSIVRDETFD